MDKRKWVCWLVTTDDLSDKESDTGVSSLEQQGLTEFISVQDLMGVKSNLLAQITDVNLTTLLAAALHYFENDSFLDIEASN